MTAEDLDSLLLRRLGLVDVPAGAPEGEPVPLSRDGLVALEVDLVARGYTLTAPLYAALARCRPAELKKLGTELLARIAEFTGADRRHRPLFRRFPDGVPRNAHSLYSARIRAFLLVQNSQRCSWCCQLAIEVGIGVLAPCAHLLCENCVDDIADHDRLLACPSCGVEIPEEPFLPLDTTEVRNALSSLPADHVLRPLRLSETTPQAAALDELLRLLRRATPLDPQDRSDLAVLLASAPADPAGWLPASIPVRETKATALAALLRSDAATARPLLPAYLTTATDVLRLLWAWSGAEPDLLAETAPRLRTLPRPLRRELLGILDALPLPAVAEDMQRHRMAWLRAGELLHPYEHQRRFPNAAAAFAVVRQTDLLVHPLGERLMDAPLRISGTGGGRNRLVATTFAAQVEELLGEGDVTGAARLLAKRPGELVRRLHHLLRVHTDWQPGVELPPEFMTALPGALSAAGAGPLLGAYGRLRMDRALGDRRLYFPRGRTALVHARRDWATAVPARLGTPVCALIEAELLRRAAARPPYELALLDEGLADLPVPFAERASARTLVAIPRGSIQRIPDGARVRLFVHWMQPHGLRVDLDLSVALYDADWRFVGLCDYTHLVHGRRSAVHSGDFTTAPPPHGATEFVDLDPARLAAEGAKYAVAIVFSYNDVSFERLTDAFAGFMEMTPAHAHGRVRFDPKAVRQRLDLAGDAKVYVPLIVDLDSRSYTWTDLSLGSSGGLHNVHRHSGRLAALASDLLHHFSDGGRTTLWDLACLAAAARSTEVLVRTRDGGTLARYRRRADETVAEFAARLREGRRDDGSETSPADDLARRVAERLTGRQALLALVHADLPAPAGLTGTAYRLYPGPMDAAPAMLERITAGDLVALFGPDASVLDRPAIGGRRRDALALPWTASPQSPQLRCYSLVGTAQTRP